MSRINWGRTKGINRVNGGYSQHINGIAPHYVYAELKVGDRVITRDGFGTILEIKRKCIYRVRIESSGVVGSLYRAQMKKANGGNLS